MRISTSQIYTQGLKSFGVQQTKLATLQQQISSGQRISKPSDDPAASARILELQQTIKLHSQYQVNIDKAESRLNLQETVFTSAENVLQRIRELALQGINATQSDLSRKSIATEIDQLQQELVSLSNTVDSNGEYLFAGHQNQSQPFTQTNIGSISHIQFNGDQGQRQVQISETRQMNIDSPGREVFMQISSSATALRESTTSVNANLAPAHVYDHAEYGQFSPGRYDLVFNNPPTTFDIIDVDGVGGTPAGSNVAGTVIATQPYTDSQNIDFQGIRTSISGSPAAGDTFTIEQGQYKDLFSVVGNLSETLSSGLTNQQVAANITQSLQDIDAGMDTILEAHTSIGGRLNALEAQFEDNAARILATRETLGKLRDTDLAEAISQLTLEQTTLDAAQAVFARITQSSLFNFLR